MEKDVEIVNAEGYDNYSCWDFKICFNYNGNPYTYVTTGSGDGCPGDFEEIFEGHLTLKKDQQSLAFTDRVKKNNVLVKTLADAVEQLLESKADELKIVAEW